MTFPQIDPAAEQAAPRRSRSVRPVPSPDGGLAAEIASLRAEVAFLRKDVSGIHAALHRIALLTGMMPPAALASRPRTGPARLADVEEELALQRELIAALAERMDGHDESVAVKANALNPPRPSRQTLVVHAGGAR